MADHLLDGSGGGEITIANGDRITKCDGSGHWIVWSEVDGQDLMILDKKDGDGSLELHGFGSITIQNKKDGNGILIVDADCGSFSVPEVNGRGNTYLRNAGAKRIALKDGDGNVYFTGKPPIIGTKNGNGQVVREGAGLAGARPPLAGIGGLLFDQTWRFQAMGMPGSVEVRIASAGAALQFWIIAGVAGTRVPIDLQVSGDQAIDIPLYIGSLSVGVSGWSVVGGQIAFDLLICYLPPLSLPPIQIAMQRIVVPRLSLVAGIGAPAVLTPADVFALVQLQQLGSPTLASTRPLLAGADLPNGVELIANGSYDFGPNWREDHLVDPSAFSGRGGVRYGDAEVYMQPGGNGHAEFRRWYSSDPTDLRFYFHVGSPFFGGGGRVIWNVYGTPQPWAGASAPTRPAMQPMPTNGVTPHDGQPAALDS